MMTQLLRLFTLIALALGTLAINAQDAQPIYRTTVPTIDYIETPQGTRLSVRVLITNISGTSATEVVTAMLVALDSRQQILIRELDSVDVAPLAAGEQRELALSTTLIGFTPGEIQGFQVRLVAPPESPFVYQDSSVFGARIPADVSGNPPPTDANIIRLPVLDIALNLRDPLTAIGVGVFAILLALTLYLLYRLYRLLFVRPPEFGNWQPPYALVPALDPYSTSGIRQGWQQHAQNNVITAPPTPNAAHIVKLLNGADGTYLAGWRVGALRLSQYDQYGRVARSQTLADRKSVRQLDRLAAQRGKLTREQAEARLKPIARRLVNQFMRRISKRSAVLPVALDIRLSARHGEVSILFELYSARGSQWTLVDRWTPEMVVIGRNIYEAYTYSLFGQTGGETFSAFKARLIVDVTRWLAVMLSVNQPAAPAKQDRPQSRPRDQRPTAPLPPERLAESVAAPASLEHVQSPPTDKHAVVPPPTTPNLPPVKPPAAPEAESEPAADTDAD